MSGVQRDPIDGIERIVAYRHLRDYPLAVQVGLSMDEELAEYRHVERVYLTMATFVSVALVVFFGMIAYLMQRLIGRDQQLTRLISYDALTGLPNRYALMESLRRALSTTTHVGKVALLHIDLDNFKSVNDTLGHAQGDDIIRQVAERFAPRMPAEAMLARFAGDEFMVLLEGDDAPAQAEPLANTLLASLKAPMVADGTSFAYSGDLERMRAEVARFAPEDVDGYERFMAHSRAVCRIGFEQLGHVPFGSVAAMLKIAPDLLRLSGHRSVYDVVARLGGSISAEHGIGQLKAGLLSRVKDPVALEMMRSIKAALDPNGILNPGKVLG